MYEVVWYVTQTAMWFCVLTFIVLVLYYTTSAGVRWINKTFEEDKIL